MIQLGAMQELSALIAEIETEAYARGRSDARKELLDILGAGGKRPAPAGARRGRRPGTGTPKPRTGGSKRAPRGSVPRFVEQALRDHSGSTVQEILALAATDEERLIRLSSIRVELQNGRKQGRYESRDRRWSLAASAPAAAGEDGSSGAPPEVEPERDDAAGAPTGGAAGASAGEPAMQDPASPEAEVGSRRKREQRQARLDLVRRSRSTGDRPARGFFPARSRATSGRGARWRYSRPGGARHSWSRDGRGGAWHSGSQCVV